MSEIYDITLCARVKYIYEFLGQKVPGGKGEGGALATSVQGGREEAG